MMRASLVSLRPSIEADGRSMMVDEEGRSEEKGEQLYHDITDKQHFRGKTRAWW